MLRPGPRLRLLSVLVAAIQLAVTAIVPWADGRLEAEARAVRAHTEAPGSHHAPVHAADCALCQHIVVAFTRPARVPAPAVVLVHAVPATAEPRLALAVLDAPSSLPRAPPRL